jgi:type I restriction enzyme S subunit
MTNQSKIEKLISELCPKGVEFREMWEVTAWDKRFNGVSKDKQSKVLSFKHVSAKNLKDIDFSLGEVKLLSTGKFDGYTTKELAGNNINRGEVITIPTGGSANLKYYNGFFIDSGNILGSSVDNKILNLKYCYYYLLTKNDFIENCFRGSGVKHPDMMKILSIKIPIPPLEVQEEIVKILDNFTELEAELEAELEVRKKQYEYYRDELLTFNSVDFLSIKNLSLETFWIMPATPKFILEEGIPYITSKNIKGGHINFINTKNISKRSYQEISRNRPILEDDILISMIGTIGEVARVKKHDLDFYGQNMYLLRLNQEKINVSYFLYFFDSKIMKRYFSSIKNSSSQGYLKAGQIESIKIPIPPLSEQKRIVSILDKFDALVNDISIGLPAELKARRQQYEYYREKLLTFKEKEYVR